MDTLTVDEFAEALKVPYTTVITWLQQGLIPDAEVVQERRGPVWQIPRAALKSFQRPKRGRPKKGQQKG